MCPYGGSVLKVTTWELASEATAMSKTFCTELFAACFFDLLCHVARFFQVTPQEDKVPDWELASEVTAFMQDSSGAPIPNIVPDSLGVYLGTERGRGVAPPAGERFAAAAAAARGGAPVAIGSDGAPSLLGDELEGPAFGRAASLSRMSEDGGETPSTPSRGTTPGRGTPPQSMKR